MKKFLQDLERGQVEELCGNGARQLVAAKIDVDDVGHLAKFSWDCATQEVG